ncbi:MAG: hypothetical protein GY705_12470 [Bacteroidetes bacterium]|nr:hypothetical protein [Bacteroidota bacterium]
MNRILELPLVVKPGTSGKFQPLKEQLPGMQNVPDISKRSLDFIYYLNVKDHGHAISTLIRLFTRLEPVSVYEKADTCALAVCYLKKYGDFISGIIDATSADEVQDLLENISDPPGNSRLKRTSPLTVGINAYLGGTYGWELWQSDILDEDVTFSGFAPSMPIGITVSKLLGKKKASFSAFLSFLDLGTLLTFYPDSDTSGENQLTFKNVFKPGIQLHWNIKKSPFFLGTGVQYGPQYRMINGKSTALGSFRYSIGFGVDVPIKTLYQK